MATTEDKLAFREKCEQHLKDANKIRGLLLQRLEVANRLKFATSEAALETSIWYKQQVEEHANLVKQASQNPSNEKAQEALREAAGRLTQWTSEHNTASREAITAAKEVDVLQSKIVGLDKLINRLYQDTGRIGIGWKLFGKKADVLPTPWDVRTRDFHPDSREGAPTALMLSNEQSPTNENSATAFASSSHGMDGFAYPIPLGSALALTTNAMTKTLTTLISNLAQGSLAGAHNPNVYPFFMQSCQGCRHSHSEQPHTDDLQQTYGQNPFIQQQHVEQRPLCHQSCTHQCWY